MMVEPSYKVTPNDWIAWYMKNHNCSLVQAIDEIMKKRMPKVTCCLECPEAHFGKYEEYTWRCSVADYVINNPFKMNAKCPLGYYHQ